jgi:hypothetical protein
VPWSLSCRPGHRCPAGTSAPLLLQDAKALLGIPNKISQGLGIWHNEFI